MQEPVLTTRTRVNRLPRLAWLAIAVVVIAGGLFGAGVAVGRLSRSADRFVPVTGKVTIISPQHGGLCITQARGSQLCSSVLLPRCAEPIQVGQSYEFLYLLVPRSRTTSAYFLAPAGRLLTGCG